MSNRKDHGLKQHGLSDDAVEAGHDFIHDAEVEEERRHSGDANTMPSMAAQAADKKKAGLEGKQPENLKGQEKAGRKG
ncbi:hypothetical protein CMUS01_12753 [Colletotrichum musicola]|uniref:Uncharacterized protein n=2 Tax=Colletotrichum orchidearum species complex TaxID=2707337 RepID=A0A8H6MYM2_9PEZI|nr:hypothetical protein CMUS01_12753 [Colletotrichum musicola]KAF6833655.1 hypothetical protein CPLU01_05376 [Colletotrichum plurivorum]